ncbi:hypothetical protein JWH04_11735 [Xanthomonas melonis]|uniref:hypothetical protein n=1 Tax=Xanthomonas melonis TaxID=56456 RepID=UPI0031C5C97F|nr:hypothetical protein [Xanthomonas melonis]
MQRRYVLVEGNVSASALDNDQFTQIVVRQAPDQRIVREHIGCADDLAETFLDVRRFMLFQMADDAPQVLVDRG